MEGIPSSYCNYTRDGIDNLLEPFTLNDLFNESIKCNPKAQRAYIVKIELGLHQAKLWSKKKRVDEIMIFWRIIKEVNKNNTKFGLTWEYSIVSAIKETIFGDNILYNETDVLPNYSDYYYSICLMKENDFSYEHISTFKEPYNRFIKDVKRTISNQIKDNRNKNNHNKLGYTASLMYIPTLSIDSKFDMLSNNDRKT